MAASRTVSFSALRLGLGCHANQKPAWKPLCNGVRRAYQSDRRVLRPAFVPARWHSASSVSRSKVYDFSEVKSLSESPSADRVLIDVREPSEFEAGYIPTAINLPIKSQPDALFLPADEFEDRFGFSKPAADQEVVFYCKSGVRSSAAAQLAQQVGYQKVAEYRGSWLDWEKNGGAAGKP